MNRIFRMHFALSLVLMPFSVSALHAEAYPDRLIRIIVPFAAGATTDTLARLAANKMAEDWKTSVIVENRPGASGIVGAAAVAKSAPDGYTLILVTDHHVSLPNMYKAVPFDPVKDFTPIIMMGRAPNVFVVNSAVPVKSIKELVEQARAHPDKWSYASAGLGGSNHMTAELFKLQADVHIQHVPYKGGAPSARAVVANEVPLSVSLLPTIEQFIKAGTVRALAITGAKRSPIFPDVPTLAESGFPGFETYEWWAMLGPAGVPQDIVKKLNEELARIMKMPDVKDKLDAIGVEYSGGGTPEETRAYVASEMEKWTKVARDAGIKAE